MQTFAPFFPITFALLLCHALPFFSSTIPPNFAQSSFRVLVFFAIPFSPRAPPFYAPPYSETHIRRHCLVPKLSVGFKLLGFRSLCFSVASFSLSVFRSLALSSPFHFFFLCFPPDVENCLNARLSSSPNLPKTPPNSFFFFERDCVTFFRFLLYFLRASRFPIPTRVINAEIFWPFALFLRIALEISTLPLSLSYFCVFSATLFHVF